MPVVCCLGGHGGGLTRQHARHFLDALFFQADPGFSLKEGKAHERQVEKQDQRGDPLRGLGVDGSNVEQSYSVGEAPFELALLFPVPQEFQRRDGRCRQDGVEHVVAVEAGSVVQLILIELPIERESALLQ